MDFPDASRFAGDARRRPRRLPRRRRLVGARLPRGRLGAEALARLPRPSVLLRAYANALLGVRRTACGTTASISPATRCPSASTTSRRRAARSATRRIDLLSESAGTRTAMIYAWRHPKSIHRSVMIGVNPPGNFLWYPRTTDEQIRQVRRALRAGRRLQRADGRPRRSIRETLADMPDHWGSCRSSRATQGRPRSSA